MAPPNRTYKAWPESPVLRCDLATLQLIPETDDDVIVALRGVVLAKDHTQCITTQSYETTKPFQIVNPLNLVKLPDKREALVLYFQDARLLGGASENSRYLVAMPLPLKNRSAFKTESEAFYLTDTQLANSEGIFGSPAITDLEGFIKSYKPYAQMGINSLDELKNLIIANNILTIDARMQKCREQAELRIQRYLVETCVKGQAGLAEKVKGERWKVFRKVEKMIPAEVLSRPFGQRFRLVQTLSDRAAAAAAGALAHLPNTAQQREQSAQRREQSAQQPRAQSAQPREQSAQQPRAQSAQPRAQSAQQPREQSAQAPEQLAQPRGEQPVQSHGQSAREQSAQSRAQSAQPHAQLAQPLDPMEQDTEPEDYNPEVAA